MAIKALDSTPSPSPSADPLDVLEKDEEIHPQPGNDISIRHSLDEKSQPLGTAADSADPRTIHGFKWFLACIALYVTALNYGLDTTIAADVQPAIVKSFGGIQKLAWIGSGFPLGSVAVILPVGYAYGKFNIKLLFMGSLVIFEGGSALCGGANNINALILGRVIAGAGGAGLYLGVLNYINALTTMREKTMYNALTGLVWGVGTVLGPVVGGGFASSSATWRWAFYINLILAAVVSPVLLLYLPNMPARGTDTVFERLREMDWLGTILNAAMYTVFVLALTFGGGQWAWNSGGTITLLVLSFVITFVFAVTQYLAVLTTPERRIFPAHLLRHRSLILLFISSTCVSTGLYVTAYYLPLLFQFAHGDSAIKAAVRLLPFIVLTVSFVMLNGALMPLTGYYMPWYTFSGVFMTVGGALMHTVTPTTPASQIYGYSILVAVGAGATQQLGYSVAVAKVHPKDVSAAVGFMNTAQVGSGTIALTIAGCVFENVAFRNLKHALSDKGFSVQDLRSAIAGTQSAIFESAPAEIREAAVSAVIGAIDQVFALVIAAGALVLIVSAFLKREKLFVMPVAGG